MDQLLAWLTDEEIARGLETATYIAGIVGIPIAIALYARSLAHGKHESSRRETFPGSGLHGQNDWN